MKRRALDWYDRYALLMAGVLMAAFTYVVAGWIGYMVRGL